jgi:putative oxidoreductase
MEAVNYGIAITIARIFLGVLFLMQGYDKIFKIGITKTVLVYKNELAATRLPGIMITSAGWYTSWVELIGGGMLIIGFLKSYVLYALGIDLVLVAVAMSLIEPLWEMNFVFPRLALVLFLLIMPQGTDIFSLDHVLQNMK